MSNGTETDISEARDTGLDEPPSSPVLPVPLAPSATVRVVVLGVLAGLTYSSWPLAYLLNRQVVGVGLASDLEVPGQPFAWLFVSLDIVSGALMLLAGAALWSRCARRPLLVWATLGYGTFGISSAVSAAVPLSCGAGRAALLACGTKPGSYGLHDAVSVVGYLALFISILGAISCSSRVHRPRQRAVAIAVGVTWAASGLVFLGLTFFGLPEVACQHLLLVATGAVIAFFPYAVATGGWSRTVISPSGERRSSSARTADRIYRS